MAKKKAIAKKNQTTEESPNVPLGLKRDIRQAVTLAHVLKPFWVGKPKDIRVLKKEPLMDVLMGMRMDPGYQRMKLKVTVDYDVWKSLYLSARMAHRTLSQHVEWILAQYLLFEKLKDEEYVKKIEELMKENPDQPDDWME